MNQKLILILYKMFHAPPETGGIVSNFPAMAKKCQDLQAGIVNAPVYSPEAPQERNIDQRLALRKSTDVYKKCSSRTQALLHAAYHPPVVDENLEKSLGPFLVGLEKFSSFTPVVKFLSYPHIMKAIREELQELYDIAHKEFECLYYSTHSSVSTVQD